MFEGIGGADDFKTVREVESVTGVSLKNASKCVN
jgi:hypothetical protein